MKTTPIPTAKSKQERQSIAFKPPANIDGRREMKVQKFGYEYTLTEVMDRAMLPSPSFMGYSGYALKSFRKLILKPVL